MKFTTISLERNMLCNKLHCQKDLKFIPFSYKIRASAAHLSFPAALHPPCDLILQNVLIKWLLKVTSPTKSSAYF